MHRSYYCKVYHWSTVSGCFEFFSKCATKYTMDFLVLEMCYYITICQNTASKDYNVSTEIGIQPYSLNGYLKVCLRKGLQQIKKLYRKKNTIMNEYDMFSSWCQLSAVLFSCLYFCFILYSPSCEVALFFCLKPVAYWWGCRETDRSRQNRLWRGLQSIPCFELSQEPCCGNFKGQVLFLSRDNWFERVVSLL